MSSIGRAVYVRRNLPGLADITVYDTGTVTIDGYRYSMDELITLHDVIGRVMKISGSYQLLHIVSDRNTDQ